MTEVLKMGLCGACTKSVHACGTGEFDGEKREEYYIIPYKSGEENKKGKAKEKKLAFPFP
jgi:hypothetical protein